MREKCVKWTLAVLAFIAISTALMANVFAEGGFGGDGSIGAGGGGGGVGKCREGLDKFGGCYNPTKAFWVKIPAVDDPANGIIDGNHMSFKNLKNRKHYFSYLRNSVASKEIFNCKNGGGSAYVLVVRMSLSTGWGGLGAGIPLSEAYNNHLDADDSGQPLPAGVEAVSWGAAMTKFNEHATEYAQSPFYQTWEPGSDLTWFCAELADTTTTTTSTPPPPPPTLACLAELTSDRSAGDTKSRIAVQNMSMDGTQPPKYSNGSPWEWKAKTNRRDGSFIQDSMWTDGSMYKGGSPQVATLAKPGDSIRFYHALCFAVRYARRVPDSSHNRWGSSQNHNTIFNLPTQSGYIGATPSNYIFDNKGIVNNVNSQLSSISAYTNLFYSPGSGSYTDASRSAIDLLQPTDAAQDYNCDNAPANYRSYGLPFIGGGYQLPGFDTGNCTSASKTGIKNPVGTEITQYHTFRSIKMWERYSHSSGNSCGCNAHGAWRTNNSPTESYKGGSNGYRRTHYCWDEGKTTKDCDKQCLGKRHPVYGYCLIPEEYTKVEYHYGDGKDDYMYSSKYSDHGTQRKEATVYIPYNYNTEVGTSLEAEDIVFQGTSINTSFRWQITPRNNPILSNFDYATVTSPNTKTQYVEFLLAPGQRKFSGTNFTENDPCAHYAGSINCHEIQTEHVGNQNPEGYYAGSQVRYRSFNRTIPDNDEYVGYKYCVAMGIWPADSHDGAGNSLRSQYTKGRNGAMDAGQLWNVSNASCRTIAKKPTFQVWNGSVYTEGEVHTSITKKKVGAGMGPFDGSGTRIFGSWADYGLYVGKENKTMASGAMLGYSGYTLTSPTGKPSGTSVQDLSPQTIANTSNPTGQSGVNANPSYGMNLLRLTSRYKDKAQTFAQTENKTGSQAKIISAQTGMHFVYYNGTLHTKDLGITYNGFPNANAVTKHSNGDITIGLGDGVNDNTMVIYATGDVVIDGNICLGNSCGDDATKLANYKSNPKIKSASALPQVLIFANNISIAENVTRVDAWLIANEGTINTCAGHSVNNVVARDAKQDYVNFGGNCDKTLVVNGPVYAHHMELLRTAGANHGYGDSLSDNLAGNDPRERSLGSTRNRTDAKRGSSAPAEIFNLRADAYIWAYNQAQRYSEAVVTYTRELAPRY